MENDKYIYKGAIHIHTKLSDGTGDINSVVKAAKKAGLDWIIITDHNYYDKDEGIFNGIYVIKGEEISPQYNNHYLALGIKRQIEPDKDPQVYVDKVREQGGFGFSAHPDEGMYIDDDGSTCTRQNSHHCIPWTNKNIKPDGIEIWNWFSNWADNLCDKSLYHLAYSYIHKHRIVKKPSRITLDWWDKLNNDAPDIVPAIGGVDAHALKFYKYIIPVTVFPYETCFSTVTNFVYLKENISKNFEIAKQQIFDAIKFGNNIIINRQISQELPDIYITNSEGTYFAGENIKLDNECCLHFEANDMMETCLIYNGKEETKYTSKKFIHPITKNGKYRLEVYYRGKGYLYTNPFNVKDIV